ncbi:Extracellular dioxygenase [Phytophthora megakarya]|uniref:Extracellular dioxygenase n=1 Tax=Phytophthora megakarya TaxID=4795 RepID=A0A225VNV8_9STRA|nr:Extracellular dioxygenase [Phytophthora megakarya]
MVNITIFLIATAMAACTLSNSATAHEEQARQVLSTNERKLFAENAQAALTQCTKSTSSRKLQERAITRRTQTVEKLRQQLGRRRLDAATVTAKSHLSTTTVTTTSTATVLFGSQTTVLVEPEVTQGPYYVSGEHIRSDMRESQKGVEMYVDVQVIDVSTCKPVENMYVDLWHANSTGVYSGIIASGNGDSSDTSNANATFLRGVTPTNSDGVAQMISIFPGHYTSRATHMHFIGNYGGKVLSNKTYSGGSIVHVGQFFFDDSLITQVEAVTPYSTNKQARTTNSNDKVLTEAAATGYDPIMNYTLIGSTINDGVFVWISLAVDLTAKQSVKAAATLTGSSGSGSGSSNSSSPSHSSSGSSMNISTTTNSTTTSSAGRKGFEITSVTVLVVFAMIMGSMTTL